MNAMTEAREHAINTHNPVIVHANCVRIGSHSNSDKQTLYRDENELAYVKAADPLQKFRRMLLRYQPLDRRGTEADRSTGKKRPEHSQPQSDGGSRIQILQRSLTMSCPNLTCRRNIQTAHTKKKMAKRKHW